MKAHSNELRLSLPNSKSRISRHNYLGDNAPGDFDIKL